jgi:hypothetical protein
LKVTTAINHAARKMQIETGLRTALIELTSSHMDLFKADPDILDFLSANRSVSTKILNWKGVDVVQGKQSCVVAYDLFGHRVTYDILTGDE